MVLIALLFLPCMVVAVTLALPILLFITSVVAMPFLLWNQSKYETTQDVVTEHSSSHTASSRRVDPPASSRGAFRKIDSDSSILRTSRTSSSRRCIRKSVSFQTHVASDFPVEGHDAPQQGRRFSLPPARETGSDTNRAAWDLLDPRRFGASLRNSLASTINVREEMKHEFERLEQYYLRPVPLGQKLEHW